MNLRTLCRPLVIILPLLAVSMPNAFGQLQSCSSYTTLQQYVSLGTTGCQLGDKVVSDFAFLFQGGTSNDSYTAPIVPPASAVTVTATVDGSFSEPDWVSLAFNFNGDASVSAYQTMDLAIQYVVTTPPLASINEVTMSSAGAVRTQSPTTSARGYVTGNVCLGGEFDVGGAFPGLTPTDSCLGDSTDAIQTGVAFSRIATANNPNVPGNQTTKSGSVSGLQQTQIGVYSDIQLIGGSTNSPTAASQAAASTLTQTFYESYEPGYGLTPEPVPVVLVGCTLVGLSWGRRQKAGR